MNIEKIATATDTDRFKELEEELREVSISTSPARPKIVCYAAERDLRDAAKNLSDAVYAFNNSEFTGNNRHLKSVMLMSADAVRDLLSKEGE